MLVQTTGLAVRFMFTGEGKIVAGFFKTTLSSSRFPLLALLFTYAIELIWVPFEVFRTDGQSEFWGYWFVLDPPELSDRSVAIAHLDYIALEMMLTTIAIFVWYFLTSPRSAGTH